MTDTDGANSIYICIREDEGESRTFKFDDDLRKISNWAKGDEAPESAPVERIIDEDNTPSSDLGTILAKIEKTSEQQHELISLINLVGQSFPRIMVENAVVEKIKESRHVVEADGNYAIYELEEGDVGPIIHQLERAATMAHGLMQMPGAILLSLVATFDSQMSEIVRNMLRIKSDRLKYGNKMLPISRIMAANSIEELIEDAIAEEIYTFSRGSHDDQISYIEEHFSIEIKKSWKRWPDLVELFERRNLVAHGERVFTARYGNICASHGHKGAKETVGKKVMVTTVYLRQASDLLTEFASLTVFSVWRKHLKDSETEAFESLLEFVYNCIKSERNELASRLCDYVSKLKVIAFKETIRLRFVVNHASSLLHLKQEQAGMKVLDDVDWTATSDDFRICVAALRKDYTEIRQILPIIKASDKLKVDELREWPVFDFVKKEEEFLSIFEEVYGEKFVVEVLSPKSTTTPKIDNEKGDIVEVSDGTVH